MRKSSSLLRAVRPEKLCTVPSTTWFVAVFSRQLNCWLTCNCAESNDAPPTVTSPKMLARLNRFNKADTARFDENAGVSASDRSYSSEVCNVLLAELMPGMELEMVSE